MNPILVSRVAAAWNAFFANPNGAGAPAITNAGQQTAWQTTSGLTPAQAQTAYNNGWTDLTIAAIANLGGVTFDYTSNGHTTIGLDPTAITVVNADAANSKNKVIIVTEGVLKSDDYTGNTEAEIEEEIKNKISDDELNTQKKEEFAKKVAPRIFLIKNLKAENPNCPIRSKLIRLLMYNEYKYSGDENLRDGEKKVKLQRKLAELRKFTRDLKSSEEGNLYANLEEKERQIIKNLELKVQARVSEMISALNGNFSSLPSLSIPFIFSVIALAVALSGVIFYFVKGIYSKELEEVK